VQNTQISRDGSPQMLHVKSAVSTVMGASFSFLGGGLVEQHSAATLRFVIGHLKLLLFLGRQIAEVLAQTVAIGAVFGNQGLRQVRQRGGLVFPDALDQRS